MGRARLLPYPREAYEFIAEGFVVRLQHLKIGEGRPIGEDVVQHLGAAMMEYAEAPIRGNRSVENDEGSLGEQSIPCIVFSPNRNVEDGSRSAVRRTGGQGQ